MIGGRGWFAPPKFTRVQGADIVMESITPVIRQTGLVQKPLILENSWISGVIAMRSSTERCGMSLSVLILWAHC
jgi:hypothetical protein